MSNGCGTDGPESDQILVPGASGYETWPLLMLFGAGIGKRKSYAGMGHAPLHFITQRGPYQDGESVLDMRYDVRTVQILIEDTLAGRTQYFDTAWDFTDMLRPNRSFGTTVRPLIYRKWLPAGKVERGNDMTTTNASATVTSNEGRFVGRGLDAGATITIGGVAYTVADVPNDYTLILSIVYAGATDTNVAWLYRRGWGKRDLFCLLESGPSFNEGLEAKHHPTGYREALRFVAHDPFWYGTVEQSQTWDIEMLSALIFDTDGTSQVRAWFGTDPGVGFWFFSIDNSVSESIEVVYWGTKGAKPIFTIIGPATNPIIDNTAIGVRLEMDYTIALGETVTINTLTKIVTNNFGENLQPFLTGNLATFELSPHPQAPNRINSIFVSFSNGSAGISAATMAWRTRDIGL